VPKFFSRFQEGQNFLVARVGIALASIPDSVTVAHMVSSQQRGRFVLIALAGVDFESMIHQESGTFLIVRMEAANLP
jgi:hypothetical protein